MKEINIKEIIPNQKYRIDIENGRKYDGTRNRIVKYATTLKEARKIRDDILYKVRNHKLSPNSNMTFYEFVKIWLEDYAKPNLKDTTVYGYRCNLNAYILPVFKDFKLSEIKAYHLEKFYNSLKERTVQYADKNGVKKNLSSTTIQKQHRQLSLIFNTAVKWGFMEDNPCKNVVKPPTQETPEMDFYDEQEIDQVLKCLEKENLTLKVAIYMLIFGGFRRAELLGLYWEDIDFEHHTVTVKRDLLNIRGKGIIEDKTKTIKSSRTVLMPPKIFELLRLYKIDQERQKSVLKDLWIESPYVFKAPSGRCIYPDWLTTNWRRFLKKNEGIRRLRLHDLRHTSATYLISKGIPVATVSKRLGHSNIYTTLNTYTHSVNQDEEKAILLFNEHFFHVNDLGGEKSHLDNL